MRIFKFGFLVFLVFIVFSSPCIAYFRTLGIAPFKLDVATRPLGMGSAFSAMYDIDSQYYNPACLVWAKGISINFKDMGNISAAQTYPTGNDSSFGLGFSTTKALVSLNGISAEAVGTIAMFSYSTALSALPSFPQTDLLESIGVGMSLNVLINEGITQSGQLDKSGNGYDMDLGFYYRANPWLSFGASGHNILPYKVLGGGVVVWRGVNGEEAIPAFFKIGTSVKVMGDIRAPIYMEGQELALAFDLEKAIETNFVYHVGGEYSYTDNFFVRAGASTSTKDEKINISFGGGYKTDGWGVNFAVNKDSIANDNLFYLNFLYFPSEWTFLSNPIESLYPPNNISTYKTTQEVYGKVRSGVKLKINSKRTTLKPGNTFNYALKLKAGANVITFETLYEGERNYRNLNIYRRTPPENPFETINIYDNYVVDEDEIAVRGRLAKGATSLLVDGKKVALEKDLSFVNVYPLKRGENRIKTTVYFEDQYVKNNFLVYRQIKMAPIAPIIKKAETKTKPKSIKKKIFKVNFKKLQQIIKKKTNILIKKEAKIYLPGYFGVYVLTDTEYIALRDIKNGVIAIDYYETINKQWKTIAKLSYSELLLFQ